MRVGSLQRQRKSSILPVIGGCLAVYAVCAVGFHALVEPSLGKNQPPPAPVLQYSAAALAARAEAVTPSPVAASRPASTAVAAAPAARAAAPKVTAKVAPAPAPTAAPTQAPAPIQAAAPTPAIAPTVALAPAATPPVAPAAAPAMALTPSAEPTVAAAATPEATADTVEKTAAVEPKKPARKRVAAPKPQPSFFDFFSGGFNNNGRANNARSSTARSTGPRSFF